MAHLSHRDTGRQQRQRRLLAVSTTVCAVSIAVGLATPAVAAPQPAAVSFKAPLHASQSKFTPRGGYSTLKATVAGATSCTLSISPAVVGFPRSVACSGTGAISVRIDFPVNPTKPLTYVATLSATDGMSAVKSSVTVVVEGFRWLGVARDHEVPSIVTAESCANPDDFPEHSSFHPPWCGF